VLLQANLQVSAVYLDENGRGNKDGNETVRKIKLETQAVGLLAEAC